MTLTKTEVPGELRIRLEAVQRAGAITELRDARRMLEGTDSDPPPQGIDLVSRQRRVETISTALDTMMGVAPGSPFHLVAPTWLVWELALLATPIALGRAEEAIDELRSPRPGTGPETQIETVCAVHAWTGALMALLTSDDASAQLAN